MRPARIPRIDPSDLRSALRVFRALGARCALGVCASTAVASPLSALPQSPDLLTRAERTGYAETSSYAEVVALAERLAAIGDDVHLTTFGYTNEGRALPLLVVGAAGATPADVMATGKTRVYLQGNIHAGEVCGKEALLMLLREYVSGEGPRWTDDLVLLVAPIYNADGNERVSLRNRPLQNGPIGGMGRRPNAQELDLNRDHMKLDSPEARAFARMMTEYDPHVLVDLHTTNGTHHAYHLTYSPPLHPNTPASIDTLLRDRWLPEVTRAIRERDGWAFYYYGNASGDPTGWYTFDHRPRFNNNYVGLRNRIAILSEAYAYLTFEHRVAATLRFTEEVLTFAGAHAAEIREITRVADATSIVGRELATRADFERSPEPVTILMGDVAEERHPGTGERILLRLDIATPTEMYEYGTFRATDTEIAPEAYYVLPEAADVIERLRAHGIEVEPQRTALDFDVERFLVTSAVAAERPFQGRVERTLEGYWTEADTIVPEGAVRVPLEQPLGRLAFSLLEPRSDDGFVDWGFFGDRTGYLPILRAPARD